MPKILLCSDLFSG